MGQVGQSYSTHRQIRIFVSSTFLDMQEERDILVKKIFPQIRNKCKLRGVELVEVDLRWGITQEQSQRGETLPICLEEIENCRPYFIGLLGERYGWIPASIDSDLFDRYEWLKKFQDSSVTELEIMHGVLNNPDMAHRAFFYFRDPDYINTLAKDKRSKYVSDSVDTEKKLQRLKEKIRKSGFPVKENYRDPEALGQLVMEQLEEIIDAEYPEGSELTFFEREALYHRMFQESRTKAYVGRTEYFQRLDQYIKRGGAPLAVLGEAGSGKSSLLANWVRDYQARHPHTFMLIHFIGGTVESSDYQKIMRRIIESIKQRYQIPDPIPDEQKKLIAAFPGWLRMASQNGTFILVLDAINQLDDKNRARDLNWLPVDLPPGVRFVVSTLPGRTSEILERRNYSMLTIQTLRKDERKRLIDTYLALFRKKLATNHIQKIMDAPQTQNPLFLRVLLGELRVFGKHEALEERINHYLEADALAPLFDKVLSRFEKDYDARPGLVKNALELIWASRNGLAESELLELLGKDGESLPRALWSPLFLAVEEHLTNRAGILTFSHDYMREAVARRYLHTQEERQRVHLALASYFSRQKVDHRILDELPWQYLQAESWTRLKETLCNMEFVVKFVNDGIKRYELFQYWQTIGSRFDMVKSYKNALSALESSQIHPKKLAGYYKSVAGFFETVGYFNQTLPLYIRALELSEQANGKSHPATINYINNLAIAYYHNGKYGRAEELYRRALQLYKKVKGEEHELTANCMDNLAALLHSKGELDAAEELSRRSLDIRIKTLGPKHEKVALNMDNLGLLLIKKKEYETARVLLCKALKIWENLVGPEHPSTAVCLQNLGILEDAETNYQEAAKYFHRAWSINKRFLGEYHKNVIDNLSGLANAYTSQRDFDNADKIFRELVWVRKKMLGKDDRTNAFLFHQLALINHMIKKYQDSEQFFRQAITLYQSFYGENHPETQTVVKNYQQFAREHRSAPKPQTPKSASPNKNTNVQVDHSINLNQHLEKAVQLFNEGKIARAEAITKQTLELSENALGGEHPITLTCLSNLGEMALTRKDVDSCISFLKRALDGREKVLGPLHDQTNHNRKRLKQLLQSKKDLIALESVLTRELRARQSACGQAHPTVAYTLYELGSLHYQRRDDDRAENLLVKALDILKTSDNSAPPYLWDLVTKLGFIFTRKGLFSQAEPLFRQAIELVTKQYGAERPQTATAISNLAEMYDDQKDYSKAEPLYFQTLELRSKIYGPNHAETARVYNNIALLRKNQGDFKGAEPLYRKAMDIFLNHFGPEHEFTRTIIENLIYLYEVMQDAESAKPLFEKYGKYINIKGPLFFGVSMGKPPKG